jgi:hypothetical protein
LTPEALKPIYERLGRGYSAATGWKSMKLCFSGKRDGWSASTFHTKCDGKGALLLVAKMKSGQTFGGYQHLPMRNSPSNYQGCSSNSQGGKVTNSGWLYRVNPSNSKKTDIYHHYRRTHYCYYRNPSYVMTWGGGHGALFWVVRMVCSRMRTNVIEDAIVCHDSWFDHEANTRVIG